MSATAIQCRTCGAVGERLEAGAQDASGQPVVSMQLPRCSCFLRANRGKLPAAVSSLLTDAPPMPEEATAAARGPPAGLARKEVAKPGAAWDAGEARRPVYSFKQLPAARELLVYDTECCDEALLGSLVVSNEHKLSDIVQKLRDELDVPAPGNLYRGTFGSPLKVPLHKLQYQKLALPFFASEQHHLLVGRAT